MKLQDSSFNYESDVVVQLMSQHVGAGGSLGYMAGLNGDSLGYMAGLKAA